MALNGHGYISFVFFSASIFVTSRAWLERSLQLKKKICCIRSRFLLFFNNVALKMPKTQQNFGILISKGNRVRIDLDWQGRQKTFDTVPSLDVYLFPLRYIFKSKCSFGYKKSWLKFSMKASWSKCFHSSILLGVLNHVSLVKLRKSFHITTGLYKMFVCSPKACGYVLEVLSTGRILLHIEPEMTKTLSSFGHFKCSRVKKRANWKGQEKVPDTRWATVLFLEVVSSCDNWGTIFQGFLFSIKNNLNSLYNIFSC